MKQYLIFEKKVDVFYFGFPIVLKCDCINVNNEEKKPIQPVMGTKVPRYAGPNTFARLPEIRDVDYCDVAIVGIPFDAGTSYRPGARFGPQSIRQASRHLKN